jgi:hypothetical protein
MFLVFPRLRLALLLGACTLPAAAQFTEVPATVAPGRFLLEMDALSLVIDRDGPDKFTAVGAGLALVTTGLSENWDIQVGAELYISQRFESGSFTERRAGIGDVYVRTKWRFYNSETLSAAIIPFVKIPTNSGGVGNDSVEGGIIVPWEAYLLGFFTLNAMVELDLVRNAADDGYDALWYGSAALSRTLTRRLALYAELDAQKTSGGGPIQSTLGVGAFLTLSDNLSWDFVMYRGLSRGAPDWNPVVRVNVGF